MPEASISAHAARFSSKSAAPVASYEYRPAPAVASTQCRSGSHLHNYTITQLHTHTQNRRKRQQTMGGLGVPVVVDVCRSCVWVKFACKAEERGMKGNGAGRGKNNTSLTLPRHRSMDDGLVARRVQRPVYSVDGLAKTNEFDVRRRSTAPRTIRAFPAAMAAATPSFISSMMLFAAHGWQALERRRTKMS